MKYRVCKMVVAYGQLVQYVAQLEADPHGFRTFDSLEGLVRALRNAAPNSIPPQDPRYIYNDVPGDIVWYPNSGDKVTGDTVVEYERLSTEERHELAKLLRQ